MANANAMTKGSTNWEVTLKDIAISGTTGTGTAMTLKTKDKYLDRNIVINAPIANMDAAVIGVASSALASDDSYTENTSAVVASGGYLTISEGYIPKTKISLATLVPNETTPSAAAEHILEGQKAYDKDGMLLTGTIPSKDSSNSSASGKTVSWPAGYYSTGGSKSVATGATSANLTTTNTGVTAVTTAGWIGSKYYIKKGSASVSGTGGTSTITSVDFVHSTGTADGTDPHKTSAVHKFTVTGSATVDATVSATVDTAGWMTASEITGGGSAAVSTVSVSAEIDEISVGTSMSTPSAITPVISTASVASGVTNAASGAATKDAPSSGVYVAVNTAGDSCAVTSSGTVTKAGYGTTSNYYYSTASKTVTVNQAGVTYVPIKTASGASLSITDKGETDKPTFTKHSTHYDITTSLTGSVSFTNVGWSSGTGNLTDSSVKVGVVDQATFNAPSASFGPAKAQNAVTGYGTASITTTKPEDTVPYLSFYSTGSATAGTTKTAGYTVAGDSTGSIGGTRDTSTKYYIPIYTGDFE